MNEPTRRTWLITISGVVSSIAAPQCSGTESVNLFSLPAGVYLPSSDHLSHALMNSGPFRSVPPGCPTDYLLPSAGPQKPLFFSPSDFLTLHRLVQLILGDLSADSSHISVEVAQWIDLRVYSCSQSQTARQRLHRRHQSIIDAYYARSHHLSTEVDCVSICRRGLVWLAGHEFPSLSRAAQIDLLASISDDASPQLSTDNPGAALFTFLKTETIKGFYTSQVGLKELNYKGNAFYARSPGCRA